MFLGTHTPRLDDKGRLALPARFRADLAGGLVITKGQERCLFVFPSAEFERQIAVLGGQGAGAQINGGPGGKAARDLSRMLFASASLETPDGQGRITIPPPLRTYAGLERDCAVIGANTRVEIWDAAAWDTYLNEHEQSYADAEEVLPGIL